MKSHLLITNMGYTVVFSYKRASVSADKDDLSLSLETIDTLDETFMG